MMEPVRYSFESINLIPTVMLAFCLVYWFIAIFGIINLDFIDFDIEVDADAVDAIAVGWLNSILHFFNVSKVPFMIFLSFLALSTWFGLVTSNYYPGNTDFGISMLLLIPNFIVGLFVSKIATTPFAKLFANPEKDKVDIQTLTGKICRINLTTSADKLGQAEVKINGSSFLIITKSREGVVLQKGETGLVIEYHESEKYSLVEPYQE